MSPEQVSFQSHAILLNVLGVTTADCVSVPSAQRK